MRRLLIGLLPPPWLGFCLAFCFAIARLVPCLAGGCCDSAGRFPSACRLFVKHLLLWTFAGLLVERLHYFKRAFARHLAARKPCDCYAFAGRLLCFCKLLSGRVPRVRRAFAAVFA